MPGGDVLPHFQHLCGRQAPLCQSIAYTLPHGDRTHQPVPEFRGAPVHGLPVNGFDQTLSLTPDQPGGNAQQDIELVETVAVAQNIHLEGSAPFQVPCIHLLPIVRCVGRRSCEKTSDTDPVAAPGSLVYDSRHVGKLDGTGRYTPFRASPEPLFFRIDNRLGAYDICATAQARTPA